MWCQSAMNRCALALEALGLSSSAPITFMICTTHNATPRISGEAESRMTEPRGGGGTEWRMRATACVTVGLRKELSYKQCADKIDSTVPTCYAPRHIREQRVSLQLSVAEGSERKTVCTEGWRRAPSSASQSACKIHSRNGSE
jgi:hypothetical protein